MCPDIRVAANYLTALGQAGGCDRFAGALGNVRRIEEDPGHLRIFLQDRGDQRSVAAPDIDYLPDSAEVVRSRNCCGDNPPHIVHRLIEYLSLLRVGGQVIEEIHSSDALECWFACLDAIEGLGVCWVCDLEPFHPYP